MAANSHHQAAFSPSTRKGNDMVRMRACRPQRFVGSSTEKVAPTVTKAQQLTDQDELNGAAMPTYGQSQDQDKR